MENKQELANTLEDIKQIMERSSRFISLSGLSGIAAGACALAGALYAGNFLTHNQYTTADGTSIRELFTNHIFYTAVVTFIAAFILAFIFTYLRSKKTRVPVWGTTARRLMINVSAPMVVGGIFIVKQIEVGAYGFISPACLIFYGLGVVNASKYTLPETRYLGYSLTLLGIINLWSLNYGIYFWALGFGIFHIIYGAGMWFKYERSN